VLLPKLKDHDVKTVDLCWFGGKADYEMNFWEAPLDGIEAIIHLAGIANDPTGELDPKVTWETNVLGTAILAQKCLKAGVKRFIYASSGSVYGISPDEVKEDSPLVPVSEYNKSKMVAERVILSYKDDMVVQIVRPATVCGWSPRMRLDVMVNSFVIQALDKGAIQFNGGEQYRPNIHIQDMTDLYVWLLDHAEVQGIFNAGFENLKIKDIAKAVSSRIGCDVISKVSTDPRSYRISSKRLLEAGFEPRKGILDAISELVSRYNRGQLRDSDECYNLKTMRLFH
jgi:nucleoside-diphosphate-sugar epimerase